MIHFDGGLKITAIDLAVDVTRRQPRGFISHAHADHMARHELAFCTPATARLCESRLGPMRVKFLPFGETVPWADARLTALPAGHMLGSAMLLAERGGRRLLFTGDFRLRESLTAESANVAQADLLVMESTFGHPTFRFPSRESIAAELVDGVRNVIRAGGTAVVHAYQLGKAQEVTRILTSAGLTVLQHPRIHRLSTVYEECGCALGDFRRYEGQPLAGCPIIAPPASHRGSGLPGLTRVTRFALTGWAVDPRRRARLQVDHALPFSDHADYDELLELIERVEPREIAVTHGPHRFAAQLRALGFNARELDPHGMAGV